MFKTLRTFYSFIFRRKLLFFSALFVLAFSTVLGNINPLIYKGLIENVETADFQGALNIIVIWIVAVMTSSVTYSLATIVFDMGLFPTIRDIRMAVFKHLHDLDFAYHSNKSSGTLISLFKRGEGAAYSFYSGINVFAVENIVGIVFMVVMLTSLYPKVLTVIFLMLGLNVIVTFFTIRKNINKRKLHNKEEDRVTAITVDNMIAYDTVMYFANENYEEQRLSEQLKPWARTGMDYGLSFREIDLANGLVIWCGVVGSVVVALLDLINGNIGLGDFVLVAGFSSSYLSKLFRLIYDFRELAKNYTDLKKYLEILDVEIPIKDTPKPKAMKEFEKELRDKTESKIEFVDVSFAYPKSPPVLKNINLEIKPGESIAFVGKSGAGKTTMVKLLMRFFDPDAGEIRIGGVNIKDITKELLRKRIGIVPQEAVLFNETIGYNIAYGSERFSMEDIERSCKAANLWDFIQTLPDGLKTVVGERGIKLSGGQKQRLAIARVVMEDAPIIVFDEATSNLDSESEKLIQEAFWKLAKKKTTIIIAHRLSTVQKADRIIVMEKGEIIEEGRHNELIMKKDGIYAQLWELQTKGVLSDWELQ